VSLALEAAVVAGGIFLGRLLSRVMKRRRIAAALPAGNDGDTASESGESDDASETDESLEGFVCRLGDVLLRRVEGDEAWLAGALVFAEDRPVAALFIAPEAHGDRALFVPGPTQTVLTWLAPVAAGELGFASLVTPGGEPPRTLEHGGTRFERTRRLPVRVERLGTGAPHVGKRAIVGEYAGAGAERLLVIAGTDAALAWRGVAMTEGEYDVLPGGKTTLRM
jgi:hypothetical protein